MYLPEHFAVGDRQALFELAQAYPFATVITHADGDLSVSHLPLLIDRAGGLLRGHVARANPQLRHFEAGAEALAIFHGPHAYVSPSVYAEQPSVPTWNYVVVHARGRSRAMGEPALRPLLDEMVARFDRTGWQFDPPDSYREKMLAAIGGFEIAVEALEGKWKLSQNKSAEDRARVAAWLARADDEPSREVSRLMTALARSR